MANSSLILNALIAKLGSDAALLALMPNGVYEDVAYAARATRFVIVSQIISTDVSLFTRGRAFEDALFLVEARSRDGGDVNAAAERIDVLLEDGTLTVAGYGLMKMHREEFIRVVEVDDVDLTIRWQRRGGRYRVQMAIAAA
jgi:hypothetical protein